MGLPKSSVAFVTGAARSQRRSHAISIDAVGADIIPLDICCEDVATVKYDPATKSGLKETVRCVGCLGRHIVSGIGDVCGLGQVHNVNLPLIMYQALCDMVPPHIDNPEVDDARGAVAPLNALPDLQRIESNDVSDPVACWSADAKFITGVALPVDAGNSVKKGNRSI
ncbi:hypothetical protein VUN82_11400 [Micrococcaceae bacterium Sec5.1]